MDEDILAVVIFTALIIMATLGCVLLCYFFARRRSVFTRALLAIAVADSFFLLPVAVLGREADIWVFVFGAAVTSLIGFPVAFLATRKLDRITQGSDLGSVFE
jgi:hypothetical protein